MMPHRALVVGGSSSVGRATVAALYDQGYEVVATHYRGALSLFGTPYPLDVRDAGAVAQLSKLPRTRAVIYMAGVMPGRPLKEYDDILMRDVFDINVMGAARVAQAMLDNAEHVIFVGSVSGVRGSFDPIYAASKAALVGLTKSLAVWHGKAVRFNCVVPALIEDSAMAAAMLPTRREHHKNANPLGRLITCAGLARVLVDLIGWPHTNGAVLDLSGLP